MSEVRFDGRVIIVTGAGRGIGRELAFLLAGRGARVLVEDIGRPVDADRYPEDHDPDPAATVAAEITAAGGNAIASRVPVGSESDARLLVEQTIDEFGRVDALINNAGVLVSGGIDALSPDDFEACLGVHLRGPFYLSQSVWPHFLRQGGGRILNVCSVAGVLFGQAGKSPYEMGKAGLCALARSLAEEGREHGISANVLLPSARTRMQAAARPVIGANTPDNRPSLVAPAGWLVHPDCPATGQIFHCGYGRMSTVFTAVGEGVQFAPDEFTLEAVRDNWAQIVRPAPFATPANAGEFMEFRERLYRKVVGSGIGSVTA
jgi:NAD(P)-dependent dehydrogenase (short-subunit alcohol dehydrogenase family)